MTLGESLRQSIAERATWLLQADDRVRQLLTQYGTVQSTLVNLWLQRHIKGLTWVMLVLSFASVLLGFASVLLGAASMLRKPMP